MRILKKIIFVFGILYVLLTVGLYFMQEKIIFLPTKLPNEYIYTFKQSFEELFIENSDGARLNALHFKVEQPKGVILYFHGNAGDLSRWGEIVSYYTRFNYDVLVMDYRSYGKSSGVLSQKALFEDAQLFYEYIAENYDEEKIVVLGRSLGTTFATYVASKNNPRQLILETPFYSMEDVAKHRFPFLPVRYLLRYKFPTYKYITNVKCPVTIFHGTSDGVVPYTSGKKLSELIPDNKGLLVTIPNGEHNNLMDFEEYKNTIENILK